MALAGHTLAENQMNMKKTRNKILSWPDCTNQFSALDQPCRHSIEAAQLNTLALRAVLFSLALVGLGI